MPEPPRLALLAGIARGSPRRALALVSGSGLKLYERLLAIFEALPALDQGAILKLADEVSPVAADSRSSMAWRGALRIPACTTLSAKLNSRGPGT